MAPTGKRARKFIKPVQKKKRYWHDSSVRAKRWRAKQGKAVLTTLTRPANENATAPSIFVLAFGIFL